MNVVNDHQVGDLAGFNGPHLNVPVRCLSGAAGDHLDQFVIGEDVAEHFVVPQVGHLQLVKG